jgi:hypothetical protein
MFSRPRNIATWAAITLVAALPAAISRTVDAHSTARQVQVAPQQQPRAAASPAPAPRGTATITVTVVTDEGTAVKGARVMVVAMPAAATGGPVSTPGQSQAEIQALRDRARSPVAKQVKTNAGGVATFTDLPGGDYSLGVMPPPGFVSRDSVPRLQVKSGGQASTTIKLNRGGVITGRILDDEGDPVTGAWVSVFRVTRGGRAQSAGASTQSTNDLGAYRVWSLPAGDYYVSVSFDERQGPPEDGVIVDGYLPTYFPGTAAFDAARPVQVKGGQETGAVDIPLVRGRLGSVSVRVTDSYGNAAGPSGPSASVNLVARTRNPAYTGRGGGMRQDGSLFIANVPAGEYYVSATLVRGTGPNSLREGAYVPVTVNGDEVAISIQTNPGATLSGRVVVEGAPPAQSGTPGAASRPAAMRVMTRSASDGAYASAFTGGDGSANSGIVKPDGTFTLTGIRGPVQITGSGARAALKAVRRGAIDISGQPIELAGTERIDDIMVVMTYDTGGIQGTVVGDSDEPLSGAAVLVVPEDPDKWNPGSPFVRTGRMTASGPGGSGTASAALPGVSTVGQPAGDGTEAFQFSLLPPGRYIVIGVADASSIGTPDRQLIEQWKGEGTVVTVDAGQTATVKVKALK